MSLILCDKIKYLEPYQPITGQYRIRLDANESFIRLDEQRIGRLGAMLTNLDFNRYPDPYANETCESFAHFYSVNRDCVTAGNGSDELISLLLGCFVQKGDRVLTFSQDFSMYRFYAHLAECEVLQLQKDEAYRVDIQAAIRAVREQNVRLVIFSNPCNPTSVGISRDDVLQLVSKTNAIVVVDEAYMDFWDQSVLEYVEQYDNLMVLKTCSKAVSAAAIRLGFAVAGKTLTRALRAAKSPYNVNALTQAAGRMLFSDSSFLMTGVKKILQSKAQLGADLFSLMEQYPGKFSMPESDTNFFYLSAANAGELYEQLLQRSIAVRHMDNHLRVSVGSPEENAEFIKEFTHLLQL